MDTKTLVVGQKIYVVTDGDYFFCQGKVTKVTPKGVEVLSSGRLRRLDELVDYGVDRLGTPMWFDNEGNNGTDGHDGQDVYGFFPWHIDDVPFAERRRGHV